MTTSIANSNIPRQQAKLNVQHFVSRPVKKNRHSSALIRCMTFTHYSTGRRPPQDVPDCAFIFNIKCTDTKRATERMMTVRLNQSQKNLLLSLNSM